MNKDIVILREAITKLIPMIAGRGLRVTQMGTGAYVKADPVTGIPQVVNIPSIPDNASPEFVTSIQGFIDHEVSHVLFTDFNYKKKEKSKRLHSLHNLFEDTMIERRMGDQFPGSKRNLATLRAWFCENISKPAIEKADSPEQAFGYILVLAIRALAGHREMKDFMDDNNLWAQPLMAALMTKLSPDFLKRIPLLKTTAETYDAAVELDLIMNPPPPPAPPQPEPQEEPEQQEDDEQGEGEEQSSEGKDDEDHSDEEQTGDGEGDGEREHTEDNENASGGEGESEEEKDEDAGDGENDGEGQGEEEADDEVETDADGGSADDSGDADDGEENAHQESDSEDSESDDADDSDANSGSQGDSEEEADEPKGKSGKADDADDQDGSGSSPENDNDADQKESDGSRGEADQSEEPGETGEDEASGEADESDEQDLGNDELDDGAAEGDSDGDSDDADAESDTDETNEGSSDNLAVETDSDADDSLNTPDDEEAKDANLPGVGYNGHNPFEALEDEDLEDKDLSSSITVFIQKEAIEAIKASEYSVFTRQYDKIEPLPVPQSFDQSHVTRMEEETRAMTGVMQKEIERMMAAQSRIFKVGGQRTGRLNGPGLHRILANDERVFARREEMKGKDTAVSLLMDCSGSMEGLKQSNACAASYALASTLERVNIPCECLGFTTAGYIGRNNPQKWPLSHREWIELQEAFEAEHHKTGAQFHRMMPIIMPVFKGFNERLNNNDIKRRFAYMKVKQPHQGGNIDGESLEYAAMRLAKRKEKRKVIIVLSDGHPAGAINDAPHLKMMTERLTKQGYDLVGIGINDHAVSRFYDKHVVLNNIADLPGEVMRQLRVILQK